MSSFVQPTSVIDSLLLHWSGLSERRASAQRERGVYSNYKIQAVITVTSHSSGLMISGRDQMKAQARGRE